MNLFVFSFLLACYAVVANGIMFTLPPNTQKCLREEIKKNDLIIGEFDVSEVAGQQVDYIVTDSKRNNIIAKKENVRGPGKFTSILDDHDIIEICFQSKASPHQRTHHEILLVIKRSAEARQVEGLAEASKLKPMEVELKKLEILADSIVRDFMDMREREQQMRDTNESTNSRVLYLSIFSMIVLFCLAIWQVMYLKKFFKAKKLIE